MKSVLKYIIVLALLVPTAAFAGGEDPFSHEFLNMFIIIMAAVIGGWIARKLNQSAVLGELIIGIAIGAVIYSQGGRLVTAIRHHAEIHYILEHTAEHPGTWQEGIAATINTLDVPDDVKVRIKAIMDHEDFKQTFLESNYTLLFSSLGVLLLLFMVGLEVTVEEMLNQGTTCLIVAVFGIVFPFILGYLGVHFLVPGDENNNMAIFVGATLGATSIGITARVFKDARAMNLKEAKLVMGAAVIDDILGLVLLAVVTAIVTTGKLDILSLGIIVGKVLLFLGFVYLVERKLLKGTIKFSHKLMGDTIFVLYPFALLMFFAWLADFIGLASIVGAFCAGMVLRDELFEEFSEGKHNLEEIHAPLHSLFAPIFFVLMGIQVDVMAFTNTGVILIGLVLSTLAILGKLLSAVFLKGYDRLAVGIGLVPRGEVGLIFASIGKAIGVLNSDMFAVIIIVVLITTLITPPFLNKKLKVLHADS